MAKPKKTQADAVDASIGVNKTPQTSTFTLKKNCGFIVDGKEHVFYPAGKEFDGEKDKETISKLVARGASFEEVKSEAEPVGSDVDPEDDKQEPKE